MTGFDRPDAAAWRARLNLRRRGREFVGPCPVCRAGTDRFRVADRDGRPGVIGCRQCDDTSRDWYADALRAAGFPVGDRNRDSSRRPPRRKMISRARTPPAPKPASEHDPATVAVARRILAAAIEVPGEVRAGWRRGLIAAAPPSPLRCLDAAGLRQCGAAVPPGAVRALVAPLGRPAAAVQLVYLDGEHRKAGAPDKLTYGPAGCRGFALGAGDVLRVAEGVADALAVAALVGGTAVAAVGSGGLRTLPLAALAAAPRRWRAVVLLPDAEDAAAVAGATAAAAEVEALAARLGALPDGVRVDSSWAPDPAAVFERGTPATMEDAELLHGRGGPVPRIGHERRQETPAARAAADAGRPSYTRKGSSEASRWW